MEIFVLGIVVLVCVSWLADRIKAERKKKRNARPAYDAKGEALFRSMFPDLLPHFHPAQLLTYVRTRNRSSLPPAGKPWVDPPGLGPVSALFETVAGRERVR